MAENIHKFKQLVQHSEIQSHLHYGAPFEDTGITAKLFDTDTYGLCFTDA